jgi:hypothetical protein
MSDYQFASADEKGQVIRNEDNAHIPPDPANRDWQEYQNWLELGNIPDPYVPPPELTASRDAVVVQMMYRANTALGAVPASGDLVWNSAVQTDASMLKLASVDGDGIDQGNFWRAPGLINRYLNIQLRSDASQIMRYTVSDVIERDSWFEIGVTPISSSGNMFAQANSLYVVIGSPGTVAAPPTSYVTQAQFSELKSQLDKIAAAILGR